MKALITIMMTWVILQLISNRIVAHKVRTLEGKENIISISIIGLIIEICAVLKAIDYIWN